MPTEMEVVPVDLRDRGVRLMDLEDAEAKRTMEKLWTTIKYEQTSRSLIDTLIMSDIDADEFFEILRSDWTRSGTRLSSLIRLETHDELDLESFQLERAGFVGIKDKIWCQGCGGVAIASPRFGTLTLMHVWMNPRCPMLLGNRAPTRMLRGRETGMVLNVDLEEVRDNLKELWDSDYVMYRSDMKTQEARRDTFAESGNGYSIDEFAKAGWYMQDHPTGEQPRCYCCGVEWTYWREDDCPILTHLKLSPGCPHLHAIMPEETVIQLLAGHKEHVVKVPTQGSVAQDYFRKIVFPPAVVTMERYKWNRKSTVAQCASDKVKEKLIIEWILFQRTRQGPPSQTQKKRRRTGWTVATIIQSYQWQTRRIDIDTRVIGSMWTPVADYPYTPNWKREDEYLSEWGLNHIINRAAPLTHDYILTER